MPHLSFPPIRLKKRKYSLNYDKKINSKKQKKISSISMNDITTNEQQNSVIKKELDSVIKLDEFKHLSDLLDFEVLKKKIKLKDGFYTMHLDVFLDYCDSFDYLSMDKDDVKKEVFKLLHKNNYIFNMFNEDTNELEFKFSKNLIKDTILQHIKIYMNKNDTYIIPVEFFIRRKLNIKRIEKLFENELELFKDFNVFIYKQKN